MGQRKGDREQNKGILRINRGVVGGKLLSAGWVLL